MNGIRGAKFHAWRRSICLQWYPLFSVTRGKATEIPYFLLMFMEGRTTMGISKTGSGVYLKWLIKVAFGCTKYAEHIWRRTFFSWGYSRNMAPWQTFFESGYSMSYPGTATWHVCQDFTWTLPIRYFHWPVAHQLDVVPITTFRSKKPQQSDHEKRARPSKRQILPSDYRWSRRIELNKLMEMLKLELANWTLERGRDKAIGSDAKALSRGFRIVGNMPNQVWHS